MLRNRRTPPPTVLPRPYTRSQAAAILDRQSRSMPLRLADQLVLDSDYGRFHQKSYNAGTKIKKLFVDRMKQKMYPPRPAWAAKQTHFFAYNKRPSYPVKQWQSSTVPSVFPRFRHSYSNKRKR